MNESFFQELLKRKVFRGIALYVVVAWLIMQAAEIVLPAFDLPNWTLRVVIISLLAGLPVAALLAWAYDLSTTGLRRERDLREEKPEPGKISRGIDFAIIAVLAVLASYFGWHYFSTGSAIPEAMASEPSIAVLPFVNMSDDASNEYFSDGISEELLNALAKVDGLKVAGRTSSFFYKGKDQDLRIIGEQLGVATVLEGSVRRSGDRVRVTAQLVSTHDGFHLWSDTFDYRLDDIFEVQDQISAAVVKALKGKLFGETLPSVASATPTSTLCYALYLRGRDELHRRTQESIVEAESLFKRAIEADSDYAPAWVGLAESYMLQYINHGLISMEQAESGAADAIRRALQLEPGSAEAYAALGLLRMEAKRYGEAETAFSQSLALNPNYPEALHWFGLLHRWRGELDLAQEKLRRAIDLDPLHRVARANFAQLLMARGDFAGAEKLAEGSISIMPEYAGNYALLASIYALGPMPQPRAALAQINRAVMLEPGKNDYWQYKISIQLELGELAEAKKTLQAFRGAMPGDQLVLVSEFSINAYEGGDATAARTLENQLQEIENAPLKFKNFFLGISNLTAGNYAEAAAAFAEVDPSLASTTPQVYAGNLQLAKLMAIAYEGMGEAEKMERLLQPLEQELKNSSRFGPEGYQLADVEIAVLRGQNDEALRRFQSAFDAGFRNRTLDGVYKLRDYPGFSPIKNLPQFVRLVDQIEQYHRNLARESA